MSPKQTVLVTGGAGYVGAMLVPELLKNYRVKVLDLYFFGDHVLDSVKDHPNLEQIKGDIRDAVLLNRVIPGCDAVIHLACISNDPSFELNPELGRSINFDAFEPLVNISKKAGVRRFIYASTSSVYGVSDAEHVGEDHPLTPMTDYSKYKALCEPILLQEQTSAFIPVVIRPATVCGYSTRQRLDLTVNILTNHAVNNRRITVFGGTQTRANIHIKDMVELYRLLLELPEKAIAGKTYNAGNENSTIMDLAERVKKTVQDRLGGAKIDIVATPTDDLRSYRISSEKIKCEIGFVPKHPLEEAASDLVSAFQSGLIPNPMNDPKYYNIKTMQALALT